MKIIASFFIVFLLAINICIAQNIDASKASSYTKTITERANKIVQLLSIIDSTKFYKVQAIIIAQYKHLSTIHDSANAQIKSLKATITDKDTLATNTAKIEADRMLQLSELHKNYFSQLAYYLTAEQMIAVKDGMTYNILPITVKAYQEMLPNITEAQKAQIVAYLTEAREYAVDAESSNKKHAWFGKYKGRINNYLSASGIDMKKASQEWEERIKAAKLAN
ncbi:MAG: DUF3826 domain-containing protein [Flavobacterium sp.]|nr:DUF3826 domain-containing protein [Flavobacterium sp.]